MNFHGRVEIMNLILQNFSLFMEFYTILNLCQFHPTGKSTSSGGKNKSGHGVYHFKISATKRSMWLFHVGGRKRVWEFIHNL